jgi:hypothetical protein
MSTAGEGDPGWAHRAADAPLCARISSELSQPARDLGVTFRTGVARMWQDASSG